MQPPAPRPAASGALSSRELNGEGLLEELAELRQVQLAQKELNDCALSARELSGMRVGEAQGRLKALAAGRFVGSPALAALLVRWAQRLKSEADVPILSSHLERLALTSAIVTALRRAQSRVRVAR